MISQTLNYKGYLAEVEFDARDAIFVGRIVGVSDRISFHGSTIAELTSDFYAAVDDYLDECRSTGQPPERPSPELPAK